MLKGFCLLDELAADEPAGSSMSKRAKIERLAFAVGCLRMRACGAWMIVGVTSLLWLFCWLLL